MAKLKGNVVINVYTESHKQLKQIAAEKGISMRNVIVDALEVYTKTKVSNAILKVKVNIQGGRITAEVLEVEQYKPWLGREDADDIKLLSDSELTTEEIEAEYATGEAPDG